MKTGIERFIDRLIKVPLDEITKVYLQDFMKDEGFTDKQIDNLVLRSVPKGYLKPIGVHKGTRKVYRIMKRDVYKTRAAVQKPLKIQIEQFHGVEIHSAKSHISDSHIDIVVTLKLKDILEAMANKL